MTTYRFRVIGYVVVGRVAKSPFLAKKSVQKWLNTVVVQKIKTDFFQKKHLF